MRLATLLLLASPLAFADNWSGLLVDSKCYAAEQRNVNPKDETTVDRDMNEQIRYCRPDGKTKNFGIVLPDWNSLSFDAGGNAKAAELVRSSGKQKVLSVLVTGERKNSIIHVDSISPEK